MRRSAPRRLMRLALLALVWGTLTGGVFSGGCHLFTPAVPETPTGPPIVVDYTTPEAALRTMARGMAGKAQGQQAWLGAFADPSRGDSVDYVCVFDPADLAYYQQVCQCTVSPDWRGVRREDQFYTAYIGLRPNEEYSVVFDSLDTDPDQPPVDHKAIRYRHYEVSATDPDSRTRLVIGIGIARLTFTEVAANHWAISRWEDQVDPEVGVNPTEEYMLTLGRRRMAFVQ